MAIRSAGTSISADTRKKTNGFTTGSPRTHGLASEFAGLSLYGDLARARSCAPALRRAARRGGRAPGTAGRSPRDAVLVDEHKRCDQLPLRIEQVHLGRGRDHVGNQVADPGAQLVDELDQALAVAAHDIALPPQGGGPERGSRLIRALPPVGA